MGSSGRVVERRTVNQADGGSIPLPPFQNCLSEETLKADGPFCLVFIPRKVNLHTQGVNM